MDARDFFGYKHPDEEPGRREDQGDEEPESPPQFDEAITLDDPAVLQRIDPQGMLRRVLALPRQVAQARHVAQAAELTERHRSVDRVVVLAMGGSAIGAELVAAVAGDRLRVPLILHRDYGLPSAPWSLRPATRARRWRPCPARARRKSAASHWR